LHSAINLGVLDEESANLGVEFFNEMTKIGFPILTLKFKIGEDSSALNFLQSLSESSVFEEQVRVFVIGDWYDSNHKFVEKAKFLMDNTKDYDKHFLNILINYDGKKELFSAIKLLLKKVELKQLIIEELDESIIKENIFNSYFLPPELIIETEKKYSGTLLWDSVGSKIFFGKKNKNLLKEGIEFFHD
jgi:undecaprenyl diphosphate synthase